MYISIHDIKYYAIQLKKLIENSDNLTYEQSKIIFQCYLWLRTNCNIYLQNRKRG